MHYSGPIQKIISHINGNLESELTLEGLAGLTNYSPYHFHRLFLMSTGEAPMEYIRRRRLRCASEDLLKSNSDIMEIALRYRFESQDGFSRAFKKLYGISPGYFKRFNQKANLSLNIKDKSKEEVHTMYETDIYERLLCSRDEKIELLTILDKLLDLSEKARRFGLLSLESEIGKVEPELFKKAIQMLIDGVEPVTLKEILLNYTLSSGFNGKELLARMLIIEGILDIQQGCPTLIIREKLASFFGEDFLGQIRNHFADNQGSLEKQVETYLHANRNKPASSKETSLLEEPFDRIDARSMQRLLRDIDEATLVTAMHGASGKIIARIATNISKKLAALLIDELETGNLPSVSEIANAQRSILETMNILRNQGDIKL